MTEPLWLYKWIDPSGTTHITTSYTEANEALHNHCLILGCRVKPIPPQTQDTLSP
jgi:hypothetical protein